MPQVTQSASNVEGSGVSGKLGLPQSVTVHSLSDQGMATSSQGGQAPKGKLPEGNVDHQHQGWKKNARVHGKMHPSNLLGLCTGKGNSHCTSCGSHKEGEHVESRVGL